MTHDFFFQAEDGIRDLVRSRGLGDVYKRQLEGRPVIVARTFSKIAALAAMRVGYAIAPADVIPVSYTHLTLPTSDLV